MFTVSPQDCIFWSLKEQNLKPLQENLSTDVVIVGGGMAGISAAQAFQERGLDVILLEQYYCGGGATGKSTGFITPDSELDLSHLVKHFGPLIAKKLWDFVDSGVSFIERNIKEYSISCDYQLFDALVVANTAANFKNQIKVDYDLRRKLGYQAELFDEEELFTQIGSRHYKGGLSYSGTFAMNPYIYCQSMKKNLQERGVRIYEDTAVSMLSRDFVETTRGYRVSAKYIVVSVDRFLPQLNKFTSQVYHVQTFVSLSQPLQEEQVKLIFPKKKFIVWDTEVIYNYYRLTGDNRILLGGGSLFNSFARVEQHNNPTLQKKLKKYFNDHFSLDSVSFDYNWPGLIGITKDLMPLAALDPKNHSTYYISAATGLPWAAALGNYSAQKMLDKRDDLDIYFDPNRYFFIGRNILGKPLSFAISILKTTYFS